MDTIILGLIVILLAILVFMIVCFKKINDSISVINDYNSKFDELTSRIDKLTSMFEIMNIENEPFMDKLHDTMSNTSQIAMCPSITHQEVINYSDEHSINSNKSNNNKDDMLEGSIKYIMKNNQSTTQESNDEEIDESQILTSNTQEKDFSEDNNEHHEELSTEDTELQNFVNTPETTEEIPTTIIDQSTIDKKLNETSEQHVIESNSQNETIIKPDYKEVIDYLNTHTEKQAKLNELRFLIVQTHISKINEDVYYMNKKDMYNTLKEITKDK